MSNVPLSGTGRASAKSGDFFPRFSKPECRMGGMKKRKHHFPVNAEIATS